MAPGSMADRRRRRLVFEVFLVVQALHLGEHVVQMVQIYVLGWPAPLAQGVVSALDVERVHAAWNAGVLVALVWLMRSGARCRWLTATFAWAALHTIEHAYLLTSALLTGLERQPGILGAGGLLARSGAGIAGLTTWSRPTVHLAWNAGEVALLVAAYVAFRYGTSTARPSSATS
jgi:hypothetical protein